MSSRTAALNTAMKVVTWLGSWVALVVAAGVIALLVLTKRLPTVAAVLARHVLLKVAGWLIAGLAVAATGFSRVELGVHWTTDVIASVAFVGCWLATSAQIATFDLVFRAK